MSDDTSDGTTPAGNTAADTRLDEERLETTEQPATAPAASVAPTAVNSEQDRETILMALDQISQTIDVMTSVVGRLRHYVEKQDHSREAELRDAMRPGRVLH